VVLDDQGAGAAVSERSRIRGIAGGSDSGFQDAGERLVRITCTNLGKTQFRWTMIEVDLQSHIARDEHARFDIFVSVGREHHPAFH
jgi:hypothetical protein